MRPGEGTKSFKKVDKDNAINIRNYLMDPNDEGIDDEGNTSIHQLTKNDDLALFE